MFELMCFIHYFGKSICATTSAAAVGAALQPSSKEERWDMATQISLNHLRCALLVPALALCHTL